MDLFGHRRHQIWMHWLEYLGRVLDWIVCHYISACVSLLYKVFFWRVLWAGPHRVLHCCTSAHKYSMLEEFRAWERVPEEHKLHLRHVSIEMNCNYRASKVSLADINKVYRRQSNACQHVCRGLLCLWQKSKRAEESCVTGKERIFPPVSVPVFMGMYGNVREWRAFLLSPSTRPVPLCPPGPCCGSPLQPSSEVGSTEVHRAEPARFFSQRLNKHTYELRSETPETPHRQSIYSITTK